MRASFLIAWFVVLISSIYDGGWAWHNREIMHEVELNPAAHYLITINDRQVDLMLHFKSIGTWMALSIMAVIEKSNWEHRTVVVWVVAAFMIGLSIFQTIW